MVMHSAGLLAYRRTGPDDGLEVFLAHMGGPFWARKQQHAWSVPKGLYDPAIESPTAAAAREFSEEIGVPAPAEPWLDLGELKLSGGKLLRTYAVAAPDLAFVASNTFELEWPRGSGTIREYAEVDRAEWVTPAAAAELLVKGQLPLLARLAAALATEPRPGD